MKLMDKNSGEQLPNFEFPKLEANEAIQEKAIEKRSDSEGGAKKHKLKVATDQTGSSSTMPLPPPSGAISVPSLSQTTSTKSTNNSGLPASDADLIEKHWVERAKAIVAQTTDDPYKQQKAMTKEKAEYIKKRFNKTIPTDDTVIS